MKITLTGALDLANAINKQSIWNKRSNDFFSDLGLELKRESLDVLSKKPSPTSKSAKSTGKSRDSVFVAKLGNTNRLRMSEGFKLASSSKYAPFFPPYKEGSSLFKWANRGQPKMNAFLVARKISRDGLKMKPFIGGVVFDNQKEIKRKGDEMLRLIAKDIANSIK